MIKRNILLNPGPATTTDSVKYAQVVPDICPREEEFVEIMKQLCQDILKIVHADPKKYSAIPFCGSGTINLDVCANSLLPENKTMLVINNGSYSNRVVDICKFYGLKHIDLKFSEHDVPNLKLIEETLKNNSDIALVHTTYHETGTGLLNPIKEIGEIVHKYDAVFSVDTTSAYAMVPINIEYENIDFCMSSAQKGLSAMTGLSFIIGNTKIIEKSKHYPTRSYYCNLYRQYEHFKKTGEMHFTPPVQTIYATRQGLKEYFEEGEQNKYKRHLRVNNALRQGIKKLGFKQLLNEDVQIGLVLAVLYPDDPNWDFEKVHDYCYDRGFTIYPGKITDNPTFRLCSFGAIDVPDIEEFFKVFEEALNVNNISIPVMYKEK